MANAETKRLLVEHSEILKVGTAQRPRRLVEIVRRARVLHERLTAEFGRFKRDVYRPLIGEEPETCVQDVHLRSMREQLIRRFESALEPGVEACLKVLGSLIERCQGEPTSS